MPRASWAWAESCPRAGREVAWSWGLGKASHCPRPRGAHGMLLSSGVDSPGRAFTGQMLCTCLWTWSVPCWMRASQGTRTAKGRADRLEETRERLKIRRDHPGLGSHFVLIHTHTRLSFFPGLSSQ